MVRVPALLAVPLLGLLCAEVGCTPSAQPTPEARTSKAVVPAVPDEVDDETTSSGPSNSPVSLTASDGTGLQIVSFEARAVVQDPLAFTEIHLVFRNPEPRALEGQFSITLPTSATLSRFAMKQDWGWQEGEVVELQAARQAYEDFLHRRQDPALMEKQPGNEFHARVFPIAPSATKEIILSYSEELPHAGEPYRVHLRGLPLLEKLDIHAIVGRRSTGAAPSSLGGTRFTNEVIEMHKQQLVPDVDFTVALAPVTQQPQAGLRNGELVVARITPVGVGAADKVTGLHVLFDTSASRALGFQKSVAKLGAIIAALATSDGADTPLIVAAFDQDTETIYEGTLGGFGAEALAKLTARRALGASDLAGVLKKVATGAKKHARVLLVTDGIATAGDLEPGLLDKAVIALRQAGVERMDALVTGGIRDSVMLEELVTVGLPRDGVVIDGNRTASTIVRRLDSATVPRLEVSVPGSSWVWPKTLKGLQPGDQTLVYASRPNDANKPFIVDLDRADKKSADGIDSHMTYPVQLTEVERPLIERAAVNARIQKLDYERTHSLKYDGDPKLREEELALSIKYRVLCSLTALLVLETEDDYARFKTDRRALTEIMTVGQGGIEVTSRHLSADAKLPTIQPPEVPAEKESADKAKGDALGGLERDGVPSDSSPSLARKTAADEGGGGQPRGGAPAQRREMQATAPAASGEAAPSVQPVMAPPPPAPRMVARSKGAMASARHGAMNDAIVDSRSRPVPVPEPEEAKQEAVDPYTGKLKEVMTLLEGKKLKEAEQKAWAWRDADAGDVLALIALGEVFENKGDKLAAARAYGSIIDLFPGRADLRRFAGERLERLGDKALALAIDTFKRARDQRPDHPASHRLLAYALLRAGQPAEAFAAIKAGSARTYPEGRFRGVDRILKEDVGLVGAAWLRSAPKMKDAVMKSLAEAGAELPSGPSLRFVLNWETDANDVDFHIFDAQGGHAFFSQPQLPSGGELYADVTTGYGPECFTIVGKPAAYPYKLQAHYYSRGPMGYGMGKLEIIEHDGQGNLRFEERPFVIMVDHAFVDLGVVKGRKT